MSLPSMPIPGDAHFKVWRKGRLGGKWDRLFKRGGWMETAMLAGWSR